MKEVVNTAPLTLVDVLSERAVKQPERLAIRFLVSDKNIQTVTYAELHQRALHIACHLQQLTVAGDRALLLLNSGLEYVTAFFGCLYAGVIAVPVYPPESKREQHVKRLQSIVDDAEATLLLTTQALVGDIESIAKQCPDARVCSVDTLAAVDAKQWVRPTLRASDVAFLQYTSGSTSAPKGVRVTHGNIMANEAVIQHGFATTEKDIVVSWLPLFHDMGLIGSLLQSIYCGYQLILMSPQFFLARPKRWLQVLSDYKATATGGPDFAFQMCAERVYPTKINDFDLSHLRLVFSGSEPIRMNTMQRFCEKFAAFGLNPKALNACYGLAEATLFVSASEPFTGMSAAVVDGKRLSQGRVEHCGVVTGESYSSDAVDKDTQAVCCGHVAINHQVIIVDPGSRSVLPSDRVGEIWFSGASVADGYWNNQAASDEVFVAREGKQWLRTGDLGFMHNDQLYITGRLKDLIIIRGHNLYPQEIEQTVEREVEWVRKGRLAAFAVELDGRETIGIAVEVSRNARKLVALDKLAQFISEVVALQFQEPADVVLLLNPGALPKTSSGKLQRSACRQYWQEGTLDILAFYQQGLMQPLLNESAPAVSESTPVAVPTGTNSAGAYSALEQDILAIWHDVLHRPVTPESHFFALGGNSLRVVELITRVNEQFNCSLPFEILFDVPRLQPFVKKVADAIATGQSSARIYPERVRANAREGLFLQSYAQSRLWFLSQFDPQNIAYNISAVLKLTGRLDIAVLQAAIDTVVSRHDILRMRFLQRDESALQYVSAAPVHLEALDISHLAPNKQPAYAEQVLHADATRPFNVSADQLIRIKLLSLSNDRHQLQLVIHHIIADGGSMRLFINELSTSYQALSVQQDPILPELPSRYVDMAEWQRVLLAQTIDSESGPSSEGERQLAYWVAQLGGEQPILSLPCDRVRPALRSQRGGSIDCMIPASLTDTLRKLASDHNASLFQLLLSSFAILLSRHAGQDDIRIGVPVAGRQHPDSHKLIGLFVNTLVMRVAINGRDNFSQLLHDVKQTVLGAQAHQDLPFEQLIDVLSPERNLSIHPLFQVMFNYQQQPDDKPVPMGQDLHIESTHWQDYGAEYDVSLDVVEGSEGLSARFIYSEDLFDNATIVRMTEHWKNVLNAVCLSTKIALDDVRLLGDDEVVFARQLPRLSHKKNTLSPIPALSHLNERDVFLHRYIEAQAAATPDGLAVLINDERYSYAELNDQANQLAYRLGELGVQCGALVGIAVERSFKQIVAILATLKAGAAFVSLDPAYPSERLTYIINDSGLMLILTQEHLVEVLPLNGALQQAVAYWCCDRDWSTLATLPSKNIDIPIAPKQLAYLIYTSGTTGEPKGVAVSQTAIAGHCLAVADTFAMSTQDRVLLFASTNFDASCEQLFVPLISGGAVVCGDIPNWSLAQLHKVIIDQSISVLDLPPAYFSEFCDHLARNEMTLPVRLCVSGGEAWSLSLAKRIRERFLAQSVINAYGPTEAVISPLLYEINDSPKVAASGVAPIGYCVGNRRAYVLDRSLQVVPQGVVGELYIGGTLLAEGYFSRAAITAERFIPDPFITQPAATGHRLYRTGDLARYDASGCIHYIGRTDQQVKVRGFRIELGEIEYQISQHSAVREAVVSVSTNTRGQQLVAYLTCVNDIDITQLKQMLSACLPEYMVPAHFVVIDVLPLTPNGKVDLSSLPAPELAEAIYTAPSNALQEILVNLWEEVLQREKIGVTDNFFDVGGDSILSIQLVSRAAEMGIQFSPRDLFQHQTIASLAEIVVILDSTASGDQPVEYEPFSLAAISDEQRNALPIDLANIVDVYPLSPMQQGMLLHTLLEPGSGVYLMQEIYTINTAINSVHFSSAWAQVIARHDALRSSFYWESGSEPLQIVQRNPASCVEHIDLRALSTSGQQQAIESLLAKERTAGFDLMREPPFKVRLCQCGPQKCVLILSDHHILLDAWSLAAIVGEFFQLYQGLLDNTQVTLPEPPQYRRFIEWLQCQDAQKAQNFWAATLTGFEHATPLLSDRVIVNQGATDIADLFDALAPEQGQRLQALAAKHRITVNTFTQAAWALVLQRYSNQRDVLFGVTVAGRPMDSHQMHKIVGLFINTIPLRITIPDTNTSLAVSEWLSTLFDWNLQLREHECLPLQQIQDASPIEKGERLFQSLLVFENAPIDTNALDGVARADAQFDSRRTHTNYPLTVVCYPGDALGLHLSYDQRFFDEPTVALLLSEFKRLLLALMEGFNAPCSDLPLLSPAQEQQVLQAYNHTEVFYPFDKGYAALFEQQVEQHTDRIAAQCRGDRWTYAQLNANANALAHQLVAMNITRDSVVAVLAERSLPLLGMMVGCLKAGGAFLSLDPELPPVRLGNILTLAKCRYVLCTQACRVALENILSAIECSDRPAILVWEDTQTDQSNNENLARAISPQQLAYIIFTSGSTGTPKGVMIHQAGMINNQLSKLPYLQLTHDDVIAQTASQSFDISVWQCLTALLCGARTEIIPDDIAHDPQRLIAHINDTGVSVLESVPSLIKTLLNVQQTLVGENTHLPSLRWMLPTGEALPHDVALAWRKAYPTIPLVNAYGPAECSDDVSLHTITDALETTTNIPIGVATDNNRLYILDDNLQPVAPRAIGELYVAGVGVGRGYLHDPARTAGVFIPHPFAQLPGERLYRTGDLARRNTDGVIEYAGRVDYQVKIRGFRIELGEIESRLRLHAAVADAVVSAQSFGGSQQLVAYIVVAELDGTNTDDHANITAANDHASTDAMLNHLRDYLQEQLPDYMVPMHWQILESMPLNNNGKIDRKQLPAIDLAQSQQTYVAPKNETQASIAAIWADVLTLERVGITDNFYALGGHSLLATQIAARIQQSLNVTIALRAMFDFNTVEGLADYVDTLAKNTLTTETTDKLNDLMAELEDA